jgi:hypothetical protein
VTTNAKAMAAGRQARWKGEDDLGGVTGSSSCTDCIAWTVDDPFVVVGRNEQHDAESLRAGPRQPHAIFGELAVVVLVNQAGDRTFFDNLSD